MTPSDAHPVGYPSFLAFICFLQVLNIKLQDLMFILLGFAVAIGFGLALVSSSLFLFYGNGDNHLVPLYDGNVLTFILICTVA